MVGITLRQLDDDCAEHSHAIPALYTSIIFGFCSGGDGCRVIRKGDYATLCRKHSAHNCAPIRLHDRFLV